MLTLRGAIEAVGGPEKASRICEVSSRAIYKWLAANRLPRTEYTGETRYAELIADASGGAFTADALRDCCRHAPESPSAA